MSLSWKSRTVIDPELHPYFAQSDDPSVQKALGWFGRIFKPRVACSSHAGGTRDSGFILRVVAVFTSQSPHPMRDVSAIRSHLNGVVLVLQRQRQRRMDRHVSAETFF
jgi:hypothetical protein